MIEGSKLEGKTLVFLKPCDSYSFNQLIAEHRVDRDKAYIIGVGCMGKLSFEKIKEQGVKGITNITIDDANENITVETLYGEKTLAYKDCMLERCHVCKGKEHQIFDETIGESRDTKDADRFAEVEKIEAMSPEEKFAFFQNELSRCIRCNACAMCVRRAAAASVSSTARSSTAHRRRTWTPLRRECSTSSVHSMLPAAAQTAASAAAYVRRAFRCISSTASSSRISTNFTVSSRPVSIRRQRAR